MKLSLKLLLNVLILMVAPVQLNVVGLKLNAKLSQSKLSVIQ